MRRPSAETHFSATTNPREKERKKLFFLGRRRSKSSRRNLLFYKWPPPPRRGEANKEGVLPKGVVGVGREGRGQKKFCLSARERRSEKKSFLLLLLPTLSFSQLLTSDFANLEDKQGTQLAVSDGPEEERQGQSGRRKILVFPDFCAAQLSTSPIFVLHFFSS